MRDPGGSLCRAACPHPERLQLTTSFPRAALTAVERGGILIVRVLISVFVGALFIFLVLWLFLRPQALVSISAGGDHSCAVVQNGGIHCWGDSWAGQLGYGNIDAIGDDEPPSVAGPVAVGRVVKQVATGSNHTCALLDDGSVRCWGQGSGGRLGYGNTDDVGDNETPASAGVVNVGGRATQIDAGGVHTCALLDTGNVRCWGANPAGELGYGNRDRIGDNETPASVGDVNVGGTVTQIATGGNHTCALLSTGAVRCWGLAFNGQLGYGNTDNIGDDESPASAGDVDVGGLVAQIDAGGNNTCALLRNGNVRCWGFGGVGQLGYGNTATIGDDENPSAAGDVQVGGQVNAVSVGGGHNCALLVNGTVRCWGDGGSGRLGYANLDTIGDNETPAAAGDVNLGASALEVSAGRQHTCAVLSNQTFRCWGESSSGQLGYGNTDDVGDDEPPVAAGSVGVP